MASDQKWVSGEGCPSASKYDTLWKICHQLLKKNSEAMMSGRIFVSSTWLNSVHSTATHTITVTMAGTSLRTRRSQKCARSIVLVLSNSEMSSPVMR